MARIEDGAEEKIAFLVERLEGLFRGYRTDIAAANKYRSSLSLSLLVSLRYDTRIGWPLLSQTIPHRVLTVGKSIRDSRFDLYDRIPLGHVARGMKRARRMEGEEWRKRREREREASKESEEDSEEDRYCLSDRNYSIQDFISIERGGQRR